MMNGAQIHKLAGALEKKRDEERGLLCEAYELALPGWGLFEESRAYLDDPTRRVFDNRPSAKVADYAADMLADLAPAGREWLKWTVDPVLERELKGAEDDGKAALAEIKQLLSARQRLAFDVMQTRSNFDAETPMAMIQAAVSTGALLIRPTTTDDMWINVSAPRIDTIAWDEDAFGRPGNVTRRIKETPAELASRWPPARWSEKFREALAAQREGGKVDAREVIEAYLVRPDGGRDYAIVECEGTNRAYKEEQTLARWVIFGEFKLPGAMYRRGPYMMKAAADARSLNDGSHQLLKAADRALSTVLAYDAYGFPDLSRLEFQEVTTIPRAEPGAGIDRVDTRADVQLGELILSDLRDRIERSMGRSSLPDRRDIGRMSAFETNIRSSEGDRRSMPPMARYYHEFTMPAAEAITAILAARGAIEPIMVDDTVVRIFPASPLLGVAARQEVAEFGAAFVAAAETYGEDAADLAVDRAAAAAWALKRQRPPEGLVRDEDARAKELQRRQEAATAAEAARSPVVKEMVKQEGAANGEAA